MDPYYEQGYRAGLKEAGTRYEGIKEMLEIACEVCWPNLDLIETLKGESRRLQKRQTHDQTKEGER